MATVENKHFNKKHIRISDNNLQFMVDNLDYFYFSTKLIESCEMLNRQMVLNQKYNLNLFEEIEPLIEKYKDSYLDQAPIRCYYNIYILYKKEDDIKQLNKTLETFRENAHFFTNNELKALYDYPQNYCIRQINRGNTKYIEILFKLQKYLIDKEFNFINGFISGISYRNIVTIAIKLKEFDWSENFIEEYKERVVPDSRDNAYNLNKAYLYYYTKNYTQTIRFLNQVEFTDNLLATFAKIILLKTYYAEKEFETLSYFITSFKLYLKRNKQLNSNFKKSADLFLNYFKKIFNIAEKVDFISMKKVIPKLEIITSDINNEKSILNRVWLLEIIEDLKK